MKRIPGAYKLLAFLCAAVVLAVPLIWLDGQRRIRKADAEAAEIARQFHQRMACTNFVAWMRDRHYTVSGTDDLTISSPGVPAFTINHVHIEGCPDEIVRAYINAQSPAF